MSHLTIPTQYQLANQVPKSLLESKEVLFLDIRVIFQIQKDRTEATIFKQGVPIVVIAPLAWDIDVEKLKNSLKEHDFSQLIIGCLKHTGKHPLFDLKRRYPQFRAIADFANQWLAQNPHIEEFIIDDYNETLQIKFPQGSLKTNKKGPFPFEALSLIEEYCEHSGIKETLYEVCFKTSVIGNLNKILFVDIDKCFFDIDRVNGFFLDEKQLELYPNKPITSLDKKDLHARCYFFNEHAVANIQFVLQFIPDIGIVLSSNWRKTLNTTECATFFPFGSFLVDRTGIDKRSRAYEIIDWLLEFKPQQFAIIDDSDDDLSVFFPQHFIKVDRNNLYSLGDRNKTIQILSSS